LTVELQLTPAHQVLVEGLGVPTDEERGVALLRRAERAGNAQAQYELGVALYTGEVKLKLNLKWSLQHAAMLRLQIRTHCRDVIAALRK
jgi:TPR repeat protein